MKFLIFVLIVFLSVNLSAQRFKAGVLLGINASQVDGDTYWGYDKAGLMAGGYVYTPLNERMDVQFELKYMAKGAHKRATDVDLTTYTSKLNYIELPLLLRIKTKKKLEWEAGFALGYLFSHSEEDADGVIPDQYGGSFNKMELSSQLGLGYRISPKFLLNMRYSYSIFPIVDFNANVNATYFRRGAFNNLFSFGGYYSF